ncbi:MAG: hypothetical protein D6785_00220, partial [Planctomycetota bacterium]
NIASNIENGKEKKKGERPRTSGENFGGTGNIFIPNGAFRLQERECFGGFFITQILYQRETLQKKHKENESNLFFSIMKKNISIFEKFLKKPERVILQ